MTTKNNLDLEESPIVVLRYSLPPLVTKIALSSKDEIYLLDKELRQLVCDNDYEVFSSTKTLNLSWDNLQQDETIPF